MQTRAAIGLSTRARLVAVQVTAPGAITFGVGYIRVFGYSLSGKFEKPGLVEMRYTVYYLCAVQATAPMQQIWLSGALDKSASYFRRIKKHAAAIIASAGWQWKSVKTLDQVCWSSLYSSFFARSWEARMYECTLHSNYD